MTTPNTMHLRLLTRAAGLGNVVVVREGKGCRRGSAHLFVRSGTTGADRARVVAFLSAIGARSTWPETSTPEHFDSASVFEFTGASASAFV